MNFYHFCHECSAFSYPSYYAAMLKSVVYLFEKKILKGFNTPVMGGTKISIFTLPNKYICIALIAMNKCDIKAVITWALISLYLTHIWLGISLYFLHFNHFNSPVYFCEESVPPLHDIFSKFGHSFLYLVIVQFNF